MPSGNLPTIPSAGAVPTVPSRLLLPELADDGAADVHSRLGLRRHRPGRASQALPARPLLRRGHLHAPGLGPQRRGDRAPHAPRLRSGALLHGGHRGSEPEASKLLHGPALLPGPLLPQWQRHTLRCRRLPLGEVLPHAQAHRLGLPRASHVRGLASKHRAEGMPRRNIQSLGRPMELHALSGGRRVPTDTAAHASALPVRLRMQ
mmetsp:Transcript_118086/g.376498  ORF Transcript_118086/g.376498 Transcript_118086/m.376498 type:complete len:205 (-) Transcript_118086:1085-1699(-)